VSICAIRGSTNERLKKLGGKGGRQTGRDPQNEEEKTPRNPQKALIRKALTDESGRRKDTGVASIRNPQRPAPLPGVGAKSGDPCRKNLSQGPGTSNGHPNWERAKRNNFYQTLTEEVRGRPRSRDQENKGESGTKNKKGVQPTEGKLRPLPRVGGRSEGNDACLQYPKKKGTVLTSKTAAISSARHGKNPKPPRQVKKRH